MKKRYSLSKNPISRHTLKKIYSLFKELCRKPFDLSKELKKFIKTNGLTLYGWGDSVDPRGDWGFEFLPYEEGNFKASYTTTLRISKVASIFKVGHCYAVDYEGERTMCSSLGYYSDKPYTKSQQKLHQIIAAELTSKGYTEVHDIDLDEAIADLKMPDDVTIFGPNVTVELLLFRDIYNILDDEN